VVKTINFPEELNERVSELATISHRSFSGQVLYMVEQMMDGGQQGRELREFMVEAGR